MFVLYYKKKVIFNLLIFFEKLFFDLGISVVGIVSISFVVVIFNGVIFFIVIIDNNNYIISILIRFFEMLDYFKDLIFLFLLILVIK